MEIRYLTLTVKYIMETEALTIPHADMQNRRFVMEPLNDLTNYFHHPVLNKSVMEILEGI